MAANFINFVPQRKEMAVLRTRAARRVYPLSVITVREAHNSSMDNPQLNEEHLGAQLKIVFYCLRCVGALPVRVTDTGLLEFKFLSLPTLQCASVYTGLAVMDIMLIRECLNTINKAETFITNILSSLIIVVSLPPLLVPMTHWRDTRSITQLVNMWSKFQLQYLQVTGRKLFTSFKKGIAFWTAVQITTTTTYILPACAPNALGLWYAAPLLISCTLVTLSVSLWSILCQVLTVTGDKVAADFQETVRNHCTADVISNYRLLWLQLSELCHETGYGMKNCISVIIIIFTAQTVMAIYALSDENNKNSILRAALFAASLIFLTQLYIICHFAHKVIKVGTSMKKELQLVDTAINKHVQNEVELFYQVVALHPTVIDLGAYTQISRNTFCLIALTMVTYLIVLIQFSMN